MSLRQRLAQSLLPLAHPRQRESLPVRLHRRRVYVLPTRFGLFYAVLIAVMLVGALNYNNNPALLLGLLLMSMGLASLIAAHLHLSGLCLQALSAEPVPAGQPVRIQLALSTSDLRVRRGLRLSCQQAEGMIPVISGEAVVAELSLPTARRGWLELGRLQVWTTQPLGLARAWAWFWPQHPVLVYPAPEPQGPPLPDLGGSGGARAKHAPHSDDMHHLRNYRAGDPLRSIAWKSSARREYLLVRESEQPTGLEIDLNWDALATLPREPRIRRLAHWVDLAEREGRRYRLRLPGQPVLGPSRGPAHRHACLRALAVLPHA